MIELKKKKILTQVHYIPVPFHPYYSNKKNNFSNIDNASTYYDSCLSIPLYFSLSDEEQKYVIKQLINIIR